MNRYLSVLLSIKLVGKIELKSFVIEYVRERGNGDASEVLDDYMEYLHHRGYVIRRNKRNKVQTANAIQKPLTIHIVDLLSSNQP